MDMPVTVDIADAHTSSHLLDAVFEYFTYVDNTFSPFKPESEISRINTKRLSPADASADVREILRVSEKTKQETSGYFDVWKNGYIDPCGIVKGWAIRNAARLLKKAGCQNYYIDAGGDVELSGHNHEGKLWRLGIRNPFNRNEIVKILRLTDCGIATSGTSVRGLHIYNPHNNFSAANDILSLTVIGPTIYEADCMATAAFAMGINGIRFIAGRNNLEGYMIDHAGMATYTGGFARFTQQPSFVGQANV